MALSRIAAPAAPVLLRRRAARGKEDGARLAERLGVPGLARPPGRLIWLHGASVGESLSMLPLIGARLGKAPGLGVLVTTGTVTSAGRMAAMLPAGAVHQFAPVDTAAAVGRFLDHWRPDLAIWVESEFWPRLMVETDARDTPMMLVNARLSERSTRAWRWAPGLARRLVILFEVVLTQDGPTRERLIALGADPARIEEAGNLKAAIGPPPADGVRLERLRRAIGSRPVWLAASTHAPEEDAAAAAHIAARPRLPGLLTLVAPRHPGRAGKIAADLAARGLAVGLRSASPEPGAGTEVFVADTLGEMGLWLRLAPVAFVGGSIAPKGGHNPFEPAALGAAVLHGPSVENFGPAYAALDRAGAARMTPDAPALGAAVAELLSDEGERGRMVRAAGEVLSRLTPDVGAIAGRALALMEHGR